MQVPLPLTYNNLPTQFKAMLKKCIIIFCALICCQQVMARHVAGGELYYKALGPGATTNTIRYEITLRLFRDCNSNGPLLPSENVVVGIYENGTIYNRLQLNVEQNVQTISLDVAKFPCLVGNINVCYQYMIWSRVIDLPINEFGYTLTRTNCCRIEGITNVLGSSIGATYTTNIPGSRSLPNGSNSSPIFNLKDTALVCAGKKFELDFGATDSNNDSLIYSFCDAFGGSSGTTPPNTINLPPLNYATGFSGGLPLGAAVSINPITGIISGVAPPSGTYVVSVCIVEYRDGKAFTEHRKDFILKVQSCDFIEAVLPSKTINCTSFTNYFENQSTSSSVTKYAWDFGVMGSNTDTSSLPNPTFTYADTGRYLVKLTVFGPKDCEGTDSTLLLVYPGFEAKFGVVGRCFKNPFVFTDSSFARYGTINKWNWNFGEPSITTDTSSKQHPTHLYANVGKLPTQLIIESTVGCIDTATVMVDVSDKPFIQLPFKDTLICSIDSLLISAKTNTNNVVWTPNVFISNTNIINPIVFPKDTIQYIITATESTCIGSDTLTINVIDSVTVFVNADTAICRTDTLHLKANSIALYYKWFTNTTEQLPNIKNPIAKPLTNSQYIVNASVGKCFDVDTVQVRSIPYPIVVASADTAICFGDKANISGNIVASKFNWTPKQNIFPQNNSLSVQVAPPITTKYFLQVSDTLGCPKLVTDTVQITVVKLPVVFAGNDTSVVVNQPLQFSGFVNEDANGIAYKWNPSLFLNNPNIANPIGVFNASRDSITYTFTATTSIGCQSSDNMVVRIYKTTPDIFVPTAFTPNNDGKNDVLKAIPVGIKLFEYLNVYNRLGQLIFTTPVHEKGWDGNINGAKQPSGTYIYTTQGIDYEGKLVFKKGTLVLIR
jgi:gliding motility-associated-like protein